MDTEYSEDLFLDNESEINNGGSSEVLVDMEVEVSTEHLLNSEENILDASNTETEFSNENTTAEESSVKKPGRPPGKTGSKEETVSRYRPLHLPLSRVKQIIKMDPDVHLAGSEAVFLIAKAAELFIELLSKDSYAFTASAKKKTIQKKDVDSAIANTDALVFLDGALDF